MIESLQQLDVSLLLAVNEWQGHEGLDAFFLGITNKYTWIPLYLFLLLYYAWQRGWKNALIFMGLSIVIVALCDLISVHLFKNVFERLRPCHNPELQGMVKIIDNRCGGSYGFVSSHAANHFGLAIWFVRVYFKDFNWYRLPFWIWAALICLSRVYLGVHYPGDVLVGALLGISIGYLVWFISRKQFNWF